MRAKEKVTVIIPVYNAENTIVRCLDSLCVTNMSEDVTIVCIDDGSTDRSVEIIDRYKQSTKLNIILKSQSNKGAAAARNYGIRSCNTQFVMFLDADDTYSDYHIDVMINEIENNDLVICGINRIKKGVDNKRNIKKMRFISKRDIFDNYSQIKDYGIVNYPCNKLYKLDIILENKLYFNESLEVGEDFIFNLNYFNYINSLLITDKTYVNYHTDDSYVTKKSRDNEYYNRKLVIEESKQIFDNNGIEYDLSIQYIKVFYSDLYQLINKYKSLLIYKKINKRSKELIVDEPIEIIIQSFEPKSFIEKLLFMPIKKNSHFSIYLMTVLTYMVKNSDRFSIRKKSM